MYLCSFVKYVRAHCPERGVKQTVFLLVRTEFWLKIGKLGKATLVRAQDGVSRITLALEKSSLGVHVSESCAGRTPISDDNPKHCQKSGD